jgi:purine-binding chemotaxis protein CheW
MVEITPLPAGPEFLHGVINYQGTILPVLDLRRRFGLPEHRIELCDQLIILHCACRSFSLMVDMVCEVRECAEQMLIEADAIHPDLPFLAGIAKLPDGLILLSDLEALLASPEMAGIDELMGSLQP